MAPHDGIPLQGASDVGSDGGIPLKGGKWWGKRVYASGITDPL